MLTSSLSVHAYTQTNKQTNKYTNQSNYLYYTNEGGNEIKTNYSTSPKWLLKSKYYIYMN